MPGGRLGGHGMMNAPGLPLTIRIREILPILLQNGAHAQRIIPKLREAIAKIEASTERPELKRVK